MDALAALLALSPHEKEARGLVHTPREISQQPDTWRRTLRNFLRLAPSLEKFLMNAGFNGGQPRPLNVLLIGAGTSDYVGKSLCALLKTQWRCEVQSIPSTDLLTNLEEYVFPERAYLWISFSRSGDSSEGVALLNSALEYYPQIYHVIVTCNAHGQMARSFNDDPRVFSIVLEDEVNDRGLAMTGSFSNMVIVGQALAHLRDLERFEPLLEDLSETATGFLLAAANVCERLVGEGFSKVCFLGTGALKGAAIESALKVLELTDGKVTSFAESFLGVRHGPLSAIDRNTLVVSFLSMEERRRAYELDLLSEIFDKGLTEKRLAVWPSFMGENRSVSVIGAEIQLSFQRPIADLYRPPVDVMVGQLLGLFASLREGLKPDAPSPLGTITRVVSHVALH